MILNETILKRLRFLIKSRLESNQIKNLNGLIRIYKEGKNKYLNKYLLDLYQQLEDYKNLNDSVKSEVIKYKKYFESLESK